MQEMKEYTCYKNKVYFQRIEEKLRPGKEEKENLKETIQSMCDSFHGCFKVSVVGYFCGITKVIHYIIIDFRK